MAFRWYLIFECRKLICARMRTPYAVRIWYAITLFWYMCCIVVLCKSQQCSFLVFKWLNAWDTSECVLHNQPPPICTVIIFVSMKTVYNLYTQVIIIMNLYFFMNIYITKKKKKNNKLFRNIHICFTHKLTQYSSQNKHTNVENEAGPNRSSPMKCYLLVQKGKRNVRRSNVCQVKHSFCPFRFIVCFHPDTFACYIWINNFFYWHKCSIEKYCRVYEITIIHSCVLIYIGRTIRMVRMPDAMNEWKCCIETFSYRNEMSFPLLFCLRMVAASTNSYNILFISFNEI